MAPELKTNVKLGPASNGMLLTPEEFDAVTDYDDLYRYELIHGVVIVSPLPSEAECDPNEELGHLLRQYKDSHPQGSALDKTLSERYVRTKDSRRRADRVVWAGLGRLPDPNTDAPTIAIEFVSKSKRDRRRDYEEKRREYLGLGIVEYWVIDRFRRILTVYRKQDQDRRNAKATTSKGKGKGSEEVLTEKDVYRPELLPGFELPIARLLALADQWRKPR